ncbi:acyltransferase [Rubellimicrobium rubrum]|uniref:Acyltransferase n=1 Tax=Rubellimicrobium rubrum TaxID=2585369 RepID=A0A5C4MQ61_9RHOB|nr:acyltransferase [Rubellimicrobium rubrum]TNC47715.1 acyltransferase [Rubellimicrobium rubrum]
MDLLTTTGSVGDPAKHPAKRILAFDGLRGVAALAVVIFHFLCLLRPTYVPTMTSTSAALTQTPIYVLWNGAFAVAIFFALSGFVMAAAADRRGQGLLVSSAARYLRLALPATASCLVAWLWLQTFSDATQIMGASLEEPSRWLGYTRQGEIGPIYHPIADGLISSFVKGSSLFNNVLWTMQVELIGSLGIFVLYRLSTKLLRIGALLLAGVAVLLVLPDAYLAFVLGAGLYEAHRSGVLERLPSAFPLAALLVGLVLGGVGPGSHETWGLPYVPERWQIGTERGLVSIFAAVLLIYAALMIPRLADLLAARVPLGLGRISFSLYLVHVPPLYTIVAWAYVTGAIPFPLLAALYFVGVLLMAWAFTLWVDEPVLRWLSAQRRKWTAQLGQSSA